MKALTLLPKKIKETYHITKDEKHIHINSPAYINIEFDERFRIEKNEITYSIANSKVCVALWIETKNMHVTVFFK